jgi:hypothetical protein
MHVSAISPRRLVRAVALGGLLLALAIPPATLAGNGNNGTVKVDDPTEDGAPITANDPKVGCSFGLQFLFGDSGQSGSWQIRRVDDGTVVDSGLYSAGSDGAATATATVPGAGHYKLFWDGDTGKHDKQKVFQSDCDGNGGGETVDQ